MKRALGLVVAFLLVGCSSTANATTAPAATPEPAAFNLAAVKASFTDECASPIIVDDLFCQQVTIGGMTADGDILNVPTTLDGAARDRAGVICDQIVRAHFDGEGVDLGFKVVGVLDRDGGHAAACSV